MHPSRWFFWSAALTLAVSPVAYAQERLGNRDVLAGLLAAIVERPSPAPLVKPGQPIDRFTLDVSLDLARRRLLDPKAVDWQESAAFLATQERGRSILEGIVIHFRMTDNVRWTDAFAAYSRAVNPEEISDQMVPEYVADLQLQQVGAGALDAIQRVGQVGPRAKAALPMLEWLANFSPDPQQSQAAIRAIRRIDPRRAPQFTGC